MRLIPLLCLFYWRKRLSTEGANSLIKQAYNQRCHDHGFSYSHKRNNFECSHKCILLPLVPAHHISGPRFCHQEDSCSWALLVHGRVKSTPLLCFRIFLVALSSSSHQMVLPVSGSVWVRLTPASMSGVYFIAPKIQEVKSFKDKFTCL